MFFRVVTEFTGSRTSLPLNPGNAGPSFGLSIMPPFASRAPEFASALFLLWLSLSQVGVVSQKRPDWSLSFAFIRFGMRCSRCRLGAKVDVITALEKGLLLAAGDFAP